MHCSISLSECLLDSFPVQVTLLGTTYFHPFPVYNVYCLYMLSYTLPSFPQYPTNTKAILTLLGGRGMATWPVLANQGVQ